MFQPPEKDDENTTLRKQAEILFPRSNPRPKEQMREIQNLKCPSIEEVRRNYLEPLARKLGWQ